MTDLTPLWSMKRPWRFLWRVIDHDQSWLIFKNRWKYLKDLFEDNIYDFYGFSKIDIRRSRDLGSIMWQI